MGAYQFGVTTEKLSAAEVARRRRIAKKHDCTFYGAEGRYWFSKTNEGEPFDGGIRSAVLAEVNRT